ncbi:putative NAD(+) ADP-ribosyltransferase transcription regulator SAP family [Medicago truncatula]|uniref:Poly [ADP-ribose] polymerase n=1 Tax=Medicago truncatula TaxID=3880 RepID=A0A396JXV6_MEDTR|nr:poly [ADP-ribose] polymerase 2 isoform X1 [Medicago truncatula]RHN81103.1 putative NAD(+) ADP-ribosyltransferase transcription regulator SAP family [Medicago truncatula]
MATATATAPSKMKVEELRTELNQRGLDTTGTKPTLLRRLQEALLKENQVSKPDADAPSSLGKRPRDSATGTRRGVSKKQSLETIPQDPHHVEQEEQVIEEEKIVTATKKGAAVLDQWLPDHIKVQYHVLEMGSEIYDAVLNQTNVGDNNNKFYAIQVLESDDGGKFLVYNRWGRVGIKGQDKIHGPYPSRESAIQEFEQKFFAKTKNAWSDRNNFVSHPKSYVWLEMDYSGKEKESTVTESPGHALRKQPQESKLEPRIAKFISLVCNLSMMNQQMMEIGYNANKLPLGKLSKSTILKGYNVLKRLADVIDKSDKNALEQLSGEFYTVIPHDFGFKKMREFVIDTPQKLKRKLEMVEALAEIEVATKLLKEDAEMERDPLYAHYQRLQCELEPVEFGTEEFSMIENYMKNTHAETHSNYTVKIVQIFRTSKKGEAERFRKFSNIKNRMLLWHGSRLTNWTGILSQGLRIAPPEAPVTGYMFGKGVYFADMFSKSANYCYPTSTSADGVLLLCEVALGDMAELLTSKYDADRLPEGKLSTKGVGATAPDYSKAQKLEDGLIVPLAKPKKNSGIKGDLMYNEYIVYNVEQIRMRYVVNVKFNFGSRR